MNIWMIMGIEWENNGNIMGIWFVIIAITIGVPKNGWFITENPTKHGMIARGTPMNWKLPSG